MAGMFFMFVIMVALVNMMSGYMQSITNNLKTKD